jgi:predicted metal-dependent HD superfamily phosphohydrolase
MSYRPRVGYLPFSEYDMLLDKEYLWVSNNKFRLRIDRGDIRLLKRFLEDIKDMRLEGGDR